MQDKFKINLFIGSDNKTHKINMGYLNKVTTLLNKYFDGFNLDFNTGYYKGTKEESLKITIFESGLLSEITAKIKGLCSSLKQELQQEQIIFSIEKPLTAQFI